MNKKKNKVFSWKIGGSAGGGQQVAGLIFTKACVRGGLFAFDSSEYPSRIRGGLVTYRVTISEDPVASIYKETNLLIALTKEAFDYCIGDVTTDGAVLYDSDNFNIPENELKNKNVYPLPLAAMAKEAGVLPIASNMIIIGVCTALLDYDLSILEEVIVDVFESKGKEVIEMNKQAIKFGHDYARKNLKLKDFPYGIRVKGKNKNSIIATSNDTLSLGAVAAGCNFVSSYPMTPASSVLHNLAAWAKRAGIIVKHPEDEISAIHMAIGASYAGARAMTATSGGGFALMTEGLTLAAITETPIVIVESQRPGPATGVPTWTEQGDLSYVCHAGHGDFLRIVLAPGDAEESFYLTAQAFNLAEVYQVPVFILLDKYISEGHQSIVDPDISKIDIDRGRLLTQNDLNNIKDYKRYELAKNGVSPRAIPGQIGGVHLANSDEHDEKGFTIEGFTPEIRNQQVEKRMAKLDDILKNLPRPQLFGPEKAKVTLIGWGSVKGPVLEALKYLENVNYLHICAPYPLSEEEIRQATSGVEKLISIENNATGQFASILQEQTGISVDDKLLKYNAAQFFPEEIVEAVNKLID